jgi:hypothetical protein
VLAAHRCRRRPPRAHQSRVVLEGPVHTDHALDRVLESCRENLGLCCTSARGTGSRANRMAGSVLGLCRTRAGSSRTHLAPSLTAGNHTQRVFPEPCLQQLSKLLLPIVVHSSGQRGAACDTMSRKCVRGGGGARDPSPDEAAVRPSVAVAWSAGVRGIRRVTLAQGKPDLAQEVWQSSLDENLLQNEMWVSFKSKPNTTSQVHC